MSGAVLVALKTEKRTLRTLTENRQLADLLYASLRPDHFGYDLHAQAFRRLSALYVKNQRFPSWDVFIDDPTLSPEAREYLAKNKRAPITSEQEMRDAIATLNSYRESRLIFQMLDRESRRLGQDTPEEIVHRVNKFLIELQRADDLDATTSSIGDRDDRERILAQIRTLMTPKRNRVIPTGFTAFDAVNGGIPRGTFMLIGGPTGTGKSLVSKTLCMNMAMRGAKVLRVSLEMTFDQEIARLLADVSGVPAVSINNPVTLTQAAKERVLESYIAFDRKLRSVGGRFDLMVPTTGVRMEQILAWARPQKYDMILIDYLGLLEGTDDTDQQWRVLGANARQGAVYATATESIVCAVVQVTDDAIIRYSRAVEEHAALSWVWKRQKDETTMAPTIHVMPRKSRNCKPVEFLLHVGWDTMSVVSTERAMGLPYLQAKEIEFETPPTPLSSRREAREGKSEPSNLKKKLSKLRGNGRPEETRHKPRIKV